MSYAINSIDKEKTLKILPGAGKLTLYGSYLQDDKPVHDIYKDQLNSDALHETLPSGPWVLDRFETEPQMCYSSSMREEHVTGTMVTRSATGGLDVTDVTDFSIGGVRSVAARASDGNVRQRWSFFRNNRLIDSEEQYYDSMQPNPLDVLFIDSNVKTYLNAAGTFIYLMLPGETFTLNAIVGIPPFTSGPFPNTANAMNTYANRTFLLGYPFSNEYAGISRVKKINSTVLSGKTVPSWSSSALDIVTVGEATIDGGIAFATGTMGGKLSNLVRKEGLYKQGEINFSGYIPGQLVPFTSQNDTNPTKTSVLTVSTSATDTQTSVNYWFSRFMGCFGDGYSRMTQLKQFISNYIDISAGFEGLDYRGTKHGLINPTPLFSNAVFNGTRYGQLRDMMEQRQYTRFSLSDNTLTEAAVRVQFINRSAPPGTLNITSGSATNSSNISKFATSAHPYDDALSGYGQIWDRDTALPETFIAL